MLVRAKRLGWDRNMDQPSTYEDYDPFEHEDIEVFGEYRTFNVRSPFVPPYRQHLVSGQVVDPKTVQEISVLELESLLGIEPERTADG